MTIRVEIHKESLLKYFSTSTELQVLAIVNYLSRFCFLVIIEVLRNVWAKSRHPLPGIELGTLNVHSVVVNQKYLIRLGKENCLAWAGQLSILSTSKDIFDIPEFYQYWARALNCLAEGYSREKIQRFQCG